MGVISPVVNDRPAVPDSITAAMASLMSPRGVHTNGNGSNGTNGNGSARLHRHTGPQIRDGVSLAAVRAATAAYLVKTLGIDVVSAAKRTGSCVAYVKAWQVMEASGDTKLMHAVLAGEITTLKAAKLLTALKAAFAAAVAASPAGVITFFKDPEVRRFALAAGLMTPEQHLQEAVTAFGIDGVFDRLVR
jgi:hypothetical protein